MVARIMIALGLLVASVAACDRPESLSEDTGEVEGVIEQDSVPVHDGGARAESEWDRAA